MPGKSLSAKEFRVGTALTLLGLLVTIWQTNSSNKLQELSQAATLLKDLDSAVTKVERQLDSYTAKYVSMELCLKKAPKNPRLCWYKEVNSDSLIEAWANLAAVLASADVYLSGKEEVQLIGELKEIPLDHRKRIKPYLGPLTTDEAARGAREIANTKELLLQKYKKLEALIANRMRS